MRIPALPIVILFVVSFLIDLYISLDIREVAGKKGRNIYWATAVLCWALLIVTICLPRRDADSGISAVMWMLFTYLTIYVGKISYLIWSALGRIISRIAGIKWRIHPARWCGVIFGAGLIGIMWLGAGYTRNHIVVSEEDIFSNKLPESFNGYKIVQLSDLHVGTWGNDTAYLQRLVDTVNSLHPNLIVFTGDIVNRQTEELTPFIEVLSGLSATDGVYSVLGNHDYGDYVDWNSPADREKNNLRLAQYQKKMGWNLLNNEKVYIHNASDSIMLIGVENWGDAPFPVYGDLDKALPRQKDNIAHQNDSSFKILLSHNPEHWNREVSKNTNIDLTLAGHTHAMQMMLQIGNWKWSPAKYRYEQWGGHFKRNNDNGEPTQLYVNIGSGAVGMPARFLSAYPEVTLITLKKGNPN